MFVLNDGLMWDVNDKSMIRKKCRNQILPHIGVRGETMGEQFASFVMRIRKNRDLSEPA